MKNVWRLIGAGLTLITGAVSLMSYIVEDKKMELYVKEEVDKRFEDEALDAETEKIEEA